MINDKLTGYRKGLRPVQPESLPAWVDRELESVGRVTVSLVEAIKALEARIEALEP